MNRRRFLEMSALGATSIAGCLMLDDGRSVGRVDCTPDTPSQSTTTATEPARVGGQWPSFQYDNKNTGFNPDAQGPGDCLGPLWRFRVSPKEFTSEINYAILTSPVISDGTLFTRDNENTLYALDAATGAVQWTTSLRGWYIYGPTYADGMLYLTSDRHVMAIDVESQTERWAHPVPTPYRRIDESKQGWMPAAPAVHNGRVFVGTHHGVFCAFDATSGDLLWHRLIPERNSRSGSEDRGTPDSSDSLRHYLPGHPAVHDGVVYVTNHPGRLYAFDTTTGEKRWVYRPDDTFSTGPTVRGEAVYVSGETGIYAVSVTDGTEKWRYGAESFTDSSPAIADETLVAVAGRSYENRNLVALDVQSGEQRWQTPAWTALNESPSIAGETVVMAMTDGLFAVELATGESVWTTQGDYVIGAPVLIDDMVFTAGGNGNVYALR